jgi:hypothetical protein
VLTHSFNNILKPAVQFLWWAVPTIFLMRGSDFARRVCIFDAAIGMLSVAAFYWGFRDVSRPSLFIFLLASIFFATLAFSFWALWFYPPLRVALNDEAERLKMRQKETLHNLEEDFDERD